MKFSFSAIYLSVFAHTTITAHPIYTSSSIEPLPSIFFRPQLSKRQFNSTSPPLTLTDLDILQFALTLEHLESAFYNTTLPLLPTLAPTLPPSSLATLTSILTHEQTHIAALSTTITSLSSTPFSPCTYTFPPLASLSEFLTTAALLEAVGISAYLGAAPLITNPDILAAAGSIVTVEGRHQTCIRTLLGEEAVPQAFDTPLGARMVASLVKPFIEECKEGEELGLEGFAKLLIRDAGGVGAGTVLRMEGVLTGVEGEGKGEKMWCAFLAGDKGVQFGEVVENGCTVPEGLGGEVYVIVTRVEGSVADEGIIAGPAVLRIS